LIYLIVGRGTKPWNLLYHDFGVLAEARRPGTHGNCFLSG
jgi:hypothetical protein